MPIYNVHKPFECSKSVRFVQIRNAKVVMLVLPFHLQVLPVPEGSAA